jgi:hypothetical protein
MAVAGDIAEPIPQHGDRWRKIAVVLSSALSTVLAFVGLIVGFLFAIDCLECDDPNQRNPHAGTYALIAWALSAAVLFTAPLLAWLTLRSWRWVAVGGALPAAGLIALGIVVTVG